MGVAASFEPLNVAGDFPLFSSSERGIGNLVYLDNAATAQKPSCVLDAMDEYYRNANANPHRSAHRLAGAATSAYESARHEIAAFVNADADEIAFTMGTTHALNTVAFGYAAPVLQPGDEIVVSILEHHSNLVPWQMVAKRTGAKLVTLLSDEAGRITDEAIGRAIGTRTRIVAVAHVSNVLGIALPVVRIARAAHDVGAIVVLDCAQSAAHMPIDVRLLEVDFAAFSGHKLYGPLGIGVLYGKRELLAATSPLMGGGGMIEDVFERGYSLKSAPAKLEAGTQNVAGAVGLAAAVRYVGALGFERIASHEAVLSERMVGGLSALPSVRLYGAPGCSGDEHSPAIVSFGVRGIEPADTAHVLDRRGVAIRAGGHCARPLMRHLGVRSLCRASLGVYNTVADVDAFLEAVEASPAEAAAAMAMALH